jgi:cytokinin riboside 5'-monophosphate phosphoribohydrolase
MNICVYCSSSAAVAAEYFLSAADLGARMAGNNHTLVYGGASVGLMGAVARAVRDANGRIISVMPEAIRNAGVTFEEADEILYTADLRNRKAAMEQRAEAFIALPGGFGTLEELLEVITLKQLRLHNKPVVLINTLGFYDRLLALFETMYEGMFAKDVYRALYKTAADAAEAIEYVETYRPVELGDKWFR